MRQKKTVIILSCFGSCFSAGRLGLAPGQCLVVENAAAGVEAGIRAGMKVLAVGSAADDARARMSLPDLRGISVDAILEAV